MKRENLQPWQQRVVDEQAELSKKLKALKSYIDSDEVSSLSSRHWFLLNIQYYTMLNYNDVLVDRIDLINKESG